MAFKVNHGARNQAIAKRRAAEQADDVQADVTALCREAASLADDSEVTVTDEGKFKLAVEKFVTLLRAGVKPKQHADACGLPESNRNKYQRWWTVARAIVSPLTAVTVADVQALGNVFAAVTECKAVLADAKIPPSDEAKRSARMGGLIRSIDNAAEVIKDVRAILIRYLTGEISAEQAKEVAAGAVIVVERKARKGAEVPA